MKTQDGKDIWITVSFDHDGNVIEVRDKNGQNLEGQALGEEKAGRRPAAGAGGPVRPRAGEACPEGEEKITTVKTLEIEYITCANVNDPCWVYNPSTATWYKTC